MTFWQFIQAHGIVVAGLVWFLYTSAVNAFPPTGTPFVWGTWLRAFMKEIAQTKPDLSALLTPQQKAVLDKMA
jgi:hypothetical protein